MIVDTSLWIHIGPMSKQGRLSQLKENNLLHVVNINVMSSNISCVDPFSQVITCNLFS